MIKVVIIGLGSIGKRHLESLVLNETNFEIYIYDKNNNQNELFNKFYKEKKFKLNKTSIVPIFKLSKIPKIIDLVIISTPADVRIKIIEKLMKIYKIKSNFWIIEKILAQSLFQLNKLERLFENKKNIWVNTARKEMPWHVKIKNHLPRNAKIEAIVEGYDWGISCNSIHFIDLFSWWTNEEVISSNYSNLNKFWEKSRREGFYEVSGELSFNFSKKSKLILRSSKKLKGLKIIINVDFQKWVIDIKKGEFFGPDNLKIKGRELLLSEMTGNIVSKLISNQTCDLTPLANSLNQHKVLLCSLIKHWNEIHNTNRRKISIT